MTKLNVSIINHENLQDFIVEDVFIADDSHVQFEFGEDFSSSKKIWICHHLGIFNYLKNVHESSLIILVLRGGSIKFDLKSYGQYIQSGKVIVIHEGSAAEQAEVLSSLINIYSYQGWQPLVPNGLVNEDPNYFRSFYRTLAAKINIKSLYRATQIQTSYMFLRNSLINAVLASRHVPLEQFKNAELNKPILIVAAGPSLNKQMPLLRKYQHLFTILAVDTVWPILDKNEIIPDFLFALDSRSKPSWIQNQVSEKTCFAVDIGCAPKLVWWNNKNHLFTTTNIGIMGLLGRMGVFADVLPTGGSVATSAFGFGLLLGGNPIVLIGQDLALTGGKDHAEGYLHTYSEKTLKNRTNDGFDVEGYYGDQVRTERQLLFYKNWFEDKIKKFPQTMVINSTEGGAKIYGSLQIPFQSVCDELSTVHTDKKPHFTSFELGFDEPHVLMLIEKIHLLIEQTKSFIDLAAKGETLIEKRTGRSEKKLLKNIDQLNYDIKNFNPDARTVVDAFSQVKMQKIIYQVAMDIEDKKMDTAIAKYLDVYVGIQESGQLGLEMLEDVKGFYETILARRSLDPQILDEFFK
jgi:hypothetical protein